MSGCAAWAAAYSRSAPAVSPLSGELVARVHARVGAPQPEQPAQLAQRLGMVVHAQVDERLLPGLPVAAGRHHHQRRRLAPAQVAALALGGVERGEQPLRELVRGPPRRPRTIASGTVSRAP